MILVIHYFQNIIPICIYKTMEAKLNTSSKNE